jgi:hypothetical protein
MLFARASEAVDSLEEKTAELVLRKSSVAYSLLIQSSTVHPVEISLLVKSMAIVHA